MDLSKTDAHRLPTFDELELEPLHELQTEGEPSFVGGLIRDYLNQLGELKRNILTAQAAGDTKALEKAAHKLKSSSAVVGLTKLAAFCAAIEAEAHAGRPTSTQVRDFEDATPDAISSLTAYLTKIGA